MTARAKFILYLIVLHAIFVALGVVILQSHRLWLFVIEGLFLISLGYGIKLINAFFGTLKLIQAGAQAIEEQDFTSHFRKVDQVEMDQLIIVYNKMIDHLKDERIRLQEQNFFLDKILAASPSGILILNFDGQITLANVRAAQILQLPTSKLLGQTLLELKTPFAQFLAALAVNEAAVLPLPGGRRIKCQRSEFLDRGFSRHFFLLEEMTEELRRSEKAAYEKLIRMMSHEVNNSIGATNSLLHSCLYYKEQLQAEDQTDFENALNVIIDRTEQLNLFMNSFAEVVRLPQPKMSPTDVQAMLVNLEILMRAESQKRRVEWRWELAESLEPIIMDKIQMEQVFVNILKNALEAIDKDGVITIKLSKTEQGSRLTIEDTGAGIAPETQAKLFTPFFSTKENGQGIGLMMIQDILTRHHFEFSLESAIGGPTRFTIFFKT